ncbi:unnamed protein product [Ceutorhynchus assimilis]|uniref:DNA topoisomerase n=1 Tax=Ceutorhynchus assimilis TaxID=467358 RepID=A0A9P0GKI2_9CUCU|nr:unnamed protein product [Ceutorhynchus assimilis]
MNHTLKLTTEFLWKRERLFDKNSCEAILDHLKENPLATIESVESKAKSKWRPLPLDTVEMEKTISKKLRINAKDTMKIAEKLYTQGYISYPRTETNIFPKELNLTSLVEQQQNDNQWGPFARRIMTEGGPTPRQGRKSDQAHPPIHPTKYADNLQGNEKRVYEYVVRHFLACVHKDAQGFETVVHADISGEKFTAKGLIILEKNYLDVYVYEHWNGKEINNYERGDTFNPTTLEMVESQTGPPKLLTEADLIALMEKHGIGTDATHADHIDTIKSREYVGLHDIYFVPGNLGMGLVEGYNNIGLEISLAKPTLRADFENDLKLICEGHKDAEVVRREQIARYKAMFQTVAEKMRLIDATLANRLDDRPENVPDEPNVSVGGDDFRPALKCPRCGNDMIIKTKKDGVGKYLTCLGYPDCKNTSWFPNFVKNVEVTDQHCQECGPDCKLLKFTFRPNPFLGEPNPNVLCVGGCDENVNETLDVNLGNRRANNEVAPTRNVASQRAPQTQTPRAVQATTPRVIAAPPQANNQNHLPPPVARSTNSGNRPAANADEDVVCQCDQTAVLLTVRKDGPNKGKQFYKCAQSVCNFFLWDPHDAANAVARPVATTDTVDVQCRCNEKAPIRTVNKEGPNKGRQFYCCPNMQNSCNFFQWIDEPASEENENLNWSFRGKTSRGQGRKTQGTRGKRKCSKCGQEGNMSAFFNRASSFYSFFFRSYKKSLSQLRRCLNLFIKEKYIYLFIFIDFFIVNFLYVSYSFSIALQLVSKNKLAICECCK